LVDKFLKSAILLNNKEVAVEKSESLFLFLQDQQGRILLVLNRKEERIRGQKQRFTKPAGWGLPGGSLEPGETEIEAVLRELEEETGIPAESIEIDFLNRDMIYYEAKLDHEEKYGIHWVFVLYAKLKVSADSLILGPEQEADVEKAVWFSPNNLPEGVYRSHRIRIKYFLSKLEKK